jgi:hypothetical protein
LVLAAVQEMDTPTVGQDWMQSTAAVASMLELLQVDVPSEKAWDRFDVASERLGPYAALFTTPRWRWVRRRRIMREIKALPHLGGPDSAATADLPARPE